jgi:hypothetical protein
MLESLARNKHSSLLAPFITYKENKVLRIGPQAFTKTFFTNTLGIAKQENKVLKIRL